MRPIDADAFAEECRKKLNMKALYSPACIEALVVDEMPTVEAIPVDWIKAFVGRRNIHFGQKVNVIDMVDQWRGHPMTFEIEPYWIPVSEQLPDFGVDVLVCNGEGVQVTAKRTGGSTDPNCWAINYCGYDYDSWDFMENGDIVAWMYLPKAYKVKEE